MWTLLNAGNEIVGFSDTPFGLAAGQSQNEVAGTMVEYATRFRVSVDKDQITADGIDEAIVTVETTEVVGSIDVSVNGTPVSVTISGGTGALAPIVSAVPVSIIVEPDDKTLYSAAGEGSLVIKAV